MKPLTKRRARHDGGCDDDLRCRFVRRAPGLRLPGATDTTFYILALYLIRWRKKTRHAVATGLIADFAGS
jgi:hypothetical protein